MKRMRADRGAETRGEYSQGANPARKGKDNSKSSQEGRERILEY